MCGCLAIYTVIKIGTSSDVLEKDGGGGGSNGQLFSVVRLKRMMGRRLSQSNPYLTFIFIKKVLTLLSTGVAVNLSFPSLDSIVPIATFEDENTL